MEFKSSLRYAMVEFATEVFDYEKENLMLCSYFDLTTWHRI